MMKYIWTSRKTSCTMMGQLILLEPPVLGSGHSITLFNLMASYTIQPRPNTTTRAYIISFGGPTTTYNENLSYSYRYNYRQLQLADRDHFSRS